MKRIVCKGSAINQDGKSNGLTAPNSLAQQEVIRSAIANAGVTPRDIGYIEAHGTGTSLGDPIEVNSLKAVLNGDNTCYLSSVKTNIGHLEAAAGIAGLIKTVLCLQKDSQLCAVRLVCVGVLHVREDAFHQIPDCIIRVLRTVLSSHW